MLNIQQNTKALYLKAQYTAKYVIMDHSFAMRQIHFDHQIYNS
jgi:hypothetical protein